MSAFVRVAHRIKPKNLEGRVVTQSADGLPVLLCPGLRVHFVPPTLRGPRTAVVRDVRQVRDDAYEVAFDGVESIGDAELVSGCYCLAAKADVAGMADLEVPQTLLGFMVVDAGRGPLGEVVEVLDGAAQAVFVVEGAFGEVMIPVVDEFVTGLDEDARTVHVNVPAGLIGLNGGPGESR